MTIFSGNSITVELGGDNLIPIRLRSDGQLLDLSAVRLRFVVQPLLELVPVLGGEVTLRTVRLTEAHVAQIGTKPRKFQLIRDEGDYQSVLWRGTIVAEGFVR